MQPSSYGAPQTFSGQHGDQGYNDNCTGSQHYRRPGKHIRLRKETADKQFDGNTEDSHLGK